ncbi:hypothetical protein T12_7890 [Trichinella patagoniensis]|uniref:Uncharacterized protein n=1 Tax=Trichinella patagoniensis TaxID=990121 RepID=A0A0V0ZU67_9BILA|nr:hypothetical protein T12_7890 [Trichinella patagoniensis]
MSSNHCAQFTQNAVEDLSIPIVEGKEIAEALACYICFLSYYPRILFSKEYMQIRPLECSAKYGNNKYLRNNQEWLNKISAFIVRQLVYDSNESNESKNEQLPCYGSGHLSKFVPFNLFIMKKEVSMKAGN